MSGDTGDLKLFLTGSNPREFKMTIPKSIYYNYDKISGYNAIFNFIITERGLGKTYGAIVKAIKNFIKNGDHFIYLRRYKSELTNAVPHIFDAIIKNKEFPDYNLIVEANKFFIQPKELEGEKGSKIEFGRAIALSTANILKSTNFSEVTIIIFDEFLLSGGVYHYLKNEVETLLDVVETIGRLRDNIKVFFLGNMTSLTNPYFAYFQLQLPHNSEFKTFRDGSIVVNYAKNSAYREVKKASRFGKLIDGTHYASYAIDNNALMDNDNFIAKKDGNCKNFSVIKIRNVKYGIWRSKVDGKFYVSLDYDPNNPCVFTFNNMDHDENTVLDNAKKSVWFRAVIDNYRVGNLWFENQNIKNEFLTILAKTF